VLLGPPEFYEGKSDALKFGQRQQNQQKCGETVLLAKCVRRSDDRQGRAKRKQPAFKAARLFNYRTSRSMLCLDKDQLLLRDFETLRISLVSKSAANSPPTQEALTLVMVSYQITDVTTKSTVGP
jgi:hypothetical protein